MYILDIAAHCVPMLAGREASTLAHAQRSRNPALLYAAAAILRRTHSE